MFSKSYSSSGIVLSLKDYSEADKLVSIFTKDHGKVRFLAKGVQKPTSRKRGHIEVFNLIKFSASKTNSIDILTEVSVLDSMSQVRADLSRLSLAYFFTEVVSRLTQDQEPNDELYIFLLKSLENLKTARQLKQLRMEFIAQMLTMMGFWPQGREMKNPDQVLEEVAERQFSSIRIGKKVLS